MKPEEDPSALRKYESKISLKSGRKYMILHCFTKLNASNLFVAIKGLKNQTGVHPAANASSVHIPTKWHIKNTKEEMSVYKTD
jgi:hypothetical protein